MRKKFYCELIWRMISFATRMPWFFILRNIFVEYRADFAPFVFKTFFLKPDYFSHSRSAFPDRHCEGAVVVQQREQPALRLHRFRDPRGGRQRHQLGHRPGSRWIGAPRQLGQASARIVATGVGAMAAVVATAVAVMEEVAAATGVEVAATEAVAAATEVVVTAVAAVVGEVAVATDPATSVASRATFRVTAPSRAAAVEDMVGVAVEAVVAAAAIATATSAANPVISRVTALKAVVVAVAVVTRRICVLHTSFSWHSSV